MSSVSSGLDAVMFRNLTSFEHQVFRGWGRAQSREESERAQNENHADQQHGEEGEFTGNVPGDGGMLFFWARLPARASTGIIISSRPPSMVHPRATLYHQVLAFRPAKAEPLFPPPEVKA